MSGHIIFPSELFEPRRVDSAFEDQFQAAQRAGFDTLLVNQDRLDEGDFDRAVRKIDAQGTAVYRGWMLTVEQYGGLHAALAARGVSLINSPEQYRHCHYLPDSFDMIRERSPATIWVPAEAGAVDIDAVVEAAAVHGDAPVVIKDYVKSRKHEWDEACFVPSASDTDRLRRVVTTFVERQSDSLAGGVVVRRFVELQSVGTHPKSGMPLTREHRVFVLDGEPLISGRYWADADYPDDQVPLRELAPVMKAVRSRFFTMDVALGKEGTWHIIELGDGQVAGLLDTVAPADFFTRLAQRGL